MRTLFDRAAEHGSTQCGILRHAVDPAARGAVRVAGRGAALRRRRAGPACGPTTSGRRWRRCECGPDGPRPQRTTKTRTAQALSRFPIWLPPTGRCVNWLCCTKSRTTSAMYSRRTDRSTSRRCAPWPNWSWGPKPGTYCGWCTRKRVCASWRPRPSRRRTCRCMPDRCRCSDMRPRCERGSRSRHDHSSTGCLLRWTSSSPLLDRDLTWTKLYPQGVYGKDG